MMTGMEETRGVILLTSPQVPNMQITVNGVHAKVHRVTLMMATLAIRISAEALCWSALLRRDATFIFLAC